MPSPVTHASSAQRGSAKAGPGTESPVAFLAAAFAPLTDAKKGREMAAYMRTTQPFLGINEPERRPVYRELCKRFEPRNASAYRASVLSIWHAGVHGDNDTLTPAPSAAAPIPKPRRDSDMMPPPHTGPREMMYAAVAYAAHFDDHVTVEHLPLYKRLITEGGWWDIVDWVSNRIVSSVVLKDRSRAASVMKRWVHDEDLWVRRAAVLCQMGHKDKADEKLLFDFALDRAEEEDFFIRKAIGWALRTHARTRPDAVRAFLAKHKDRFAPLTVKEAGKHVGVRA